MASGPVRIRNWEQQIGIQATAIAAAAVFLWESTRALSGIEAIIWIGMATCCVALAVRLIAPAIEFTQTGIVARQVLRTHRVPFGEAGRFVVVGSPMGPWQVPRLERKTAKPIDFYSLSSPNRLFRSKNKFVTDKVARLNVALTDAKAENADNTSSAAVQGDQPVLLTEAFLFWVGPVAAVSVVMTTPLAFWVQGLLVGLALLVAAALRKHVHRKS